VTNILVVEDEIDMATVIRDNLVGGGYAVDVAKTAEAGLEYLIHRLPDLVITDLRLPGMSGIKFCEVLKSDARTATLPVIMLTVLGKEAEKVRGLNVGADDYVVKPFMPHELLARVEALLRRVRYAGSTAPVLKWGDLSVDITHKEVRLGEKSLTLRPKEYDLLVLLLKSAGRLVTVKEAGEALWRDTDVAVGNSLRLQIKNLRQALGPYGKFIEVVMGRGYKLTDPR